MSRYFLSAHSFVCMAGDHAVFLNLERDKYTALEPADARALAGVVRGWPQPAFPLESQRGLALARTLLREGLLTADERLGKQVTDIPIPRVTTTIDDVKAQFPRVDRRDCFSFIRAWLLTTLMLKVLPLRVLVQRVRNRKARCVASARTPDVHELHRLMTVYFILRPNFFSAKDACLRDSLTFVEFLARYDIYPTWVFGVKMEPFAAHSWVQLECMVLNDFIPVVARFTPILAV
jgi:hypothetical protein